MTWDDAIYIGRSDVNGVPYKDFSITPGFLIDRQYPDYSNSYRFVADREGKMYSGPAEGNDHVWTFEAGDIIMLNANSPSEVWFKTALTSGSSSDLIPGVENNGWPIISGWGRAIRWDTTGVTPGDYYAVDINDTSRYMTIRVVAAGTYPSISESNVTDWVISDSPGGASIGTEDQVSSTWGRRFMRFDRRPQTDTFYFTTQRGSNEEYMSVNCQEVPLNIPIGGSTYNC